MAADTVTAVTGLIEPKAVAIKLQTLGFLAIADYFFATCVLVKTSLVFGFKTPSSLALAKF